MTKIYSTVVLKAGGIRNDKNRMPERTISSLLVQDKSANVRDGVQTFYISLLIRKFESINDFGSFPFISVPEFIFLFCPGTIGEQCCQFLDDSYVSSSLTERHIV